MPLPPHLRQLRYFSVVAETLNFNGAAKKLNISQPAISRAISNLELDLGHKLFDRTTRHVSLTPEGAALADGARDMWQTLDGALRRMDQISKGNAGDLTIAYSAQAAHGPMSGLLVAFKRDFPTVRIKLRLMSSEEQLTELEKGQIDLGFLLSAAVPSTIKHVKIAQERLVALMPIYHGLSARKKIPLHALANEDFIMGTRARWQTFRALIESACLKSNFLPNIVGTADDVPLLLEMVAAGQGITLYGQSIVNTLQPTIASVPIEGPEQNFEISLFWNDKNCLPTTKSFIACTKKYSGLSRTSKSAV